MKCPVAALKISSSVVISIMSLFLLTSTLHAQDWIKSITEDSINNKNKLMSDLYKYSDLSPQEAAKVMTLPEGFKVIAAAGEPDIQQPIAMTIDDRGRLWVAEGYSYPIRRPEGEGKDRIIIFEDADHDGLFEKRKVFKDNLNLVSGIEVGFGGVWVGAAPYLLFIADKNMDDIPDSEPVVLLDGWHYEDTHETLNSFIWGPDGWLYGCHGVFTHSRVGKPGTPDDKRIPINAAIWRYHPTKHQFEVFAHGTSNPWGVDFNDEGQSFLTCCVIPHLFHVIQGARYHRQSGVHFNPYTYDDIKTVALHRHWTGNQWGNPDRTKSNEIGGGHAHAGAMIYLGGLWPEKYRNQLFMNNIHGARINMDLLTPKGSGYSGNFAPDFIKTNDSWSQILYLRYGPDGNVYMIDWYDRNQCHHGKVEGHDRGNGRIFKVVYQEKNVEQAPEKGVRNLNDEQLVQLQLHKNDWWVRTSRRVLQERYHDKPMPENIRKHLLEIVTGNKDHTRRLRALWTLHVTGGLTNDQLLMVFNDENPYVRAWGVQLASESENISDPLLQELVRLASTDPSGIVRLYLASSVQRLSYEPAMKILTPLVQHAEDKTDHNLPLMYWYGFEKHCMVNLDKSFALANQSRIGLLREYFSRRLTEDGEPQKITKALDFLAGENSINQERQLEVLLGMTSGSKGRKKLDPPENWSKYSEKLYASSGNVKNLTLQMGALFRDENAIEAYRNILADHKQELNLRKNSLNTLFAIGDTKLFPVLVNLLSDAGMRIDTLNALSNYDKPEVADAVLKLYPTFNLNEKRAALNTLASRKQSSLKLLMNTGKEADKIIKPVDLSAELVRQMTLHNDKQILELLTDKWGNVRVTPEERIKQIEGLKKFISENKGRPDLAHGRAIYMKTCQQCHTLFNQGGKIGPELTGSNRANLDYILSNIIDPSSVMAKDYVPQVFLLSSGRTITGIIKEQNDFSMTVVNQQEKMTIAKEDIVEQKASEQSMMPDNILKGYTNDQIYNLVKYLEQSGQQPVLAIKDSAPLFFNGINLDLWQVKNPSFVTQKEYELKLNPEITKPVSMESDFELMNFKLNFTLNKIPEKMKMSFVFNENGVPALITFTHDQIFAAHGNQKEECQIAWKQEKAQIQLVRSNGELILTVNDQVPLKKKIILNQRLRFSMHAITETSDKQSVTINGIKLETP